MHLRHLIYLASCVCLAGLQVAMAADAAVPASAPPAKVAPEPGPLLDVGVASVDITPRGPIRLSGYGNRREEATEVSQKLSAKALAFGSDDAQPAVWITVDLIGVPAVLIDALAERLAKKSKVERARLAVCATHTHTGPFVRGTVPFMFGEPIPPEHQQHIDQYADQLLDALERVALDALKTRQPSRLAWTQGILTFASNRRVLIDGKWTGFGDNPIGPVDRAMPLLSVTAADGTLRAVLVNYACHCTVHGGKFNQIHGDWAGEAQSQIQARHPGAIAMIAIGCGADSNPIPRGGLAEAAANGKLVADEVDRLLKSPPPAPQRALKSLPECRLERFDLPLDATLTTEEWQAQAQSKGRNAFYSQVIVDRLARGERLATSFPYTVQTWTFDDDLAMVFLAGEVVVDYAVRLKSQPGGERLWINAYANDLPCYITSRRVILEGGYEVETSMSFYDKPGRLSLDAENLIVAAVNRLLPASFKASRTAKTAAATEPKASGSMAQVSDPPALPPSAEQLAEAITPPTGPQESLQKITVRPGMTVELVAAEPLVMDPVDMAWGPDGRLWVVEMADYPLGIDGQGTPGGRVRTLEDTDHDGRYDRSTLFADGLNFPTGVMPWRGGVLISAAPDILYAEDTNGDGRADVRRVLYSGFVEGNQQHRVNGLQWGLDNWIYLANGDSDGQILSLATQQKIDIRGRDLRIRPDTGDLDPQTGRAQFGRVRDDWNNWFGCNNSNPLWHYALADPYLRRNPHVVAPKGTVPVPNVPGAAPVFPRSRTVARFNDYAKSNHFTSACGLIVYRDTLLGSEFAGNAFICEPVHNLVHREVMEADGVTFKSRRADDEQTSEFFASSDNWCRPTAVRTGPDGAIWIVDMYRQVIEHPKWIPEEAQKKFDLRAGSDRGRIYRVFPKNASPRSVPRLDRMTTVELVAALDSPSGTQRDLVHQMLLWRHDPESLPLLTKMTLRHERPLARLHALCVLDGLDALTVDVLAHALRDSHAGVRRHAVRLSETRLASSSVLAEAVLALVDDADPQLQMQLAYSLGAWQDARACRALATLGIRHAADPYLLAAVLSSVSERNLSDVVSEVIHAKGPASPPATLMLPLLRMASRVGERDLLIAILDLVVSEREPPIWQQLVLADLLDALSGRQMRLDQLAEPLHQELLGPIFARARATAGDRSATEEARLAAIRLLARTAGNRVDDFAQLTQLLQPQHPPAIQTAALLALARDRSADVPQRLLVDWDGRSPRLREETLDLLTSREAWTRAVLDEIAAGRLSAAQFDATRRQMLLEHQDPAIRQLATKLLAGTVASDRRKVVEEFADVAQLPGDAARGRVTFQKKCAVCHRLENVGENVGADLAGLKNKSAAAVLEALLDPNRAVEDRYVSYIATTDDGRVLTGILAEESGTSITLRGQQGKQEVILREQLEALRSTGKSLMPEGLEKDLARQDFADLIVYLNQLPAPPASPPARKPKRLQLE